MEHIDLANQLEYKEFLSRFKLIRHEKNLHFGDYLLMKDKQSNHNVYVKNHLMESIQDLFELESNLLENIELNKCPNLVEFIAYSKSFPPHTEEIFAFIVYDCIGISLE